MSTNQELRRLQEDFAANRITRRDLWKGAAALGLSGMWIAALERGAIAGPAPDRSQLRARGQDTAQTLIIAVAENIDTWDPAFTVGSKSSQTTIQNVFDQLTQYEVVEAQAPDGTPYLTVDTENIIGMLAETWTMDGADMVFSLRDDITYHSGEPIDSNAMLQGYRRIYESQAISSFLLSMGGAITGSEAFSAPDENTFVISMTKANPLTPKNNVMHNTASLNPTEIEANSTDADPWALEYFRANLGDGNGPYRLESYVPDDSIVLVAAENYYGEAPFFTTVIMRIVADATARVQLLANGDVDSATKIPFPEYETLSAEENIKTLSIPSNLVVMIEMNNTIAPFDVKEVRQAVAFATPYQDIIDTIYLGQAAEAKSLVPSGMPTSDFSTNQYVYDLEQAAARLEAGGFPGGEGLPEIKLTVSADDQQKERIAILLQDSLRQIGMNVTIEKLAYAQYNELQQGSRLQIWLDEWISWVNDPFYHLSWLAASTSPTNYPKFASERVDELIAEFTLSDDVEAREAASKEIQAIVIEESPYAFVCQPNWIIYFGADINGYIYYNDELPRYASMTRTEG
ncbi:ABC transporter substrate-binding protein [soil metagenome]